MDDDDDFTFPTVAAARGPTAPEGQLGRRDDDDPEPHLLQLPTLPSPSLAGAASPLWPFAASIPKTTTTTAPSPSPPLTAADNEQERSAVAKEEEEEDHRVADDEDRMDQLWEDTPTTTTRPVATRSVAGHAHAGPPPAKQRAAAADVEDDDRQRAAALAHAERMDKLWESFNEDLVLRHRRDRSRGRRAKSATGISISIKVSRAASGGGLDDPADDDRWYLCDYDSPSSGADGDESDQETTSASSPAERRGYGCAPTMLRASSRAGGAGQFCAASPRARQRGRGRGAAAGWALLLRLFRRLFAVDKTAPSSSRSSSSIYVP